MDAHAATLPPPAAPATGLGRLADRLDSAVGTAVELVAAVLVLAEIVILGAGVTARYAFHAPLVWSDELASILFLWLSMLGAVVALEPATGRIRVLVNAPRTAYLNRALNGLYPPGSTFKVFMAAAALSAGVDPVFDCPAAGWRPNVSTPPIRDAEVAEFARRRKAWKGFGRIGMGEAMVHSANTYFAQLGYALGSERFDTAVAAARLRDSASVLSAGTIELASAAGGVPEGASASALAPVAIGQGALQLTPLAVALVTAAVADDGLILAPTLSAAAKPALRARPFTMAVAQRVKRMMRAAVRRGTGRACDIPGLGVCGKTGTAQTGKGADHAWFTCFAPEASPRLVVTVLVESGGFGAKAAVPVAREILLEAKRLGYFK